MVENYSGLLPFYSSCGIRKVKTDDVSAPLHREFLLILTTTVCYAAKDPTAKMRGNQAGLVSKPQFSGLLRSVGGCPCLPDAVDGNWGCWSSWSSCDATYRRSRTRECNNPAPQQGGKRCEGERQQEEHCTFSIMQNE